MSELITLTISAIALRASVVGVLATALGLLREVLRQRQFSPRAQQVFESLTAGVPTTTSTLTLPNKGSIRASLQNARSLGLSAEEARLITELATVASLSVEDTERMGVRLLETTPDRWAEILRDEHTRLFRRHLLDATERACRSCGWTHIQRRNDGLIAEDRGGRALAVSIADDGTLRAEVLGIADGTCRSLLDHFLRALEEEGVSLRIQGRRRTGGVPYTGIGSAWVHHRGRRTSTATPSPTSKEHGRPPLAEIWIGGKKR
jgi:hypothetical protein